MATPMGWLLRVRLHPTPQDVPRHHAYWRLCGQVSQSISGGVGELIGLASRPYNGAVAADEMQAALAMTVHCASDPYVVLGVEAAYDMLAPDHVSGIATNTAAGIDLLPQLTDLPAFNIRDKDTYDQPRRTASRSTRAR